MLRNPSYEQLDLLHLIEYHRIPKNHILLELDSELSFSYVNDLVADKYNKDFGRPAWKPETLVRIALLQRLYNLSDKAVIDEIAVNRAFEYFCHLSPVDDLPHPTTLCKFRTMRLGKNNLDDILTGMVSLMIEKGVINEESGLIIDSTHINANTSSKLPEQLMEDMAKKIFRETAEKNGLTEEETKASVREKAGQLPRWEEYEDHTEGKNDMKKALEEVIAQSDPELESVAEAKDILDSELFMEQKGIRSLQDKDARVGRKDSTTSFFGYKSEFMMTEDGIITGMTVQPGNYRDGNCFKELLEKSRKAGIVPNAAYGDKAYCRPDVLGEIKELGINAYIPISHAAYRINEELFKYNKDSDRWTCINGNESGIGKKKKRKESYQIEYTFERECCRKCPHRDKCIGKETPIARKLIIGPATGELYDQSQFTKSEEFLKHYKVRSRIEPKNAEMKRFHGLGRANGYGLESMYCQALFTAMAVNLLRMVAINRQKKAG